MTAGYGAAAYVVGWSSNELAVWRTANGTQWRKASLNVVGLTYHASMDLDVNIVAGSQGVIVIGNDAVTPPSFHGFYVWRSLDQGRTFGQPIWVPMHWPYVIIRSVQSTANGFLIGVINGSAPIILSSANGLRWTRISSEGAITDTYITTPIDENASTMVAFNWNAKPGQPLAIYLRKDIWYPSTVDPGRLPDAGVVPDNQRTVNAVCNWGTGFIAIGNVSSGTEFSGMVWYSADGSRWNRQPVRSNGFEAVGRFMDAAVSNGKALLVADPAQGSDLLMWQAAEAG